MNINLEISSKPDPDQTIEILMTDLEPGVMSIFSKRECSNGFEATEVLPITSE